MWNVTRVPSFCLRGTGCQQCQRTIVDEYSKNVIRKDVCGRACQLSRPCTVRVNVSSQSSDQRENRAGSTGNGSPAGGIELGVSHRSTITGPSMRDSDDQPSRGGAGGEQPPSHSADVCGERSRGGGDPASGSPRDGVDLGGPRQPDTSSAAQRVADGNLADARSMDSDAGVLGALAAGLIRLAGTDRSVMGNGQQADSDGRAADPTDDPIGPSSASHSTVLSSASHSNAPQMAGGILAGVQRGCSGDDRGRPPVERGEPPPLGFALVGCGRHQGSQYRGIYRSDPSYIRWVCARSKNARPAQLDFINFSRAMSAQASTLHQPAPTLTSASASSAALGVSQQL